MSTDVPDNDRSGDGQVIRFPRRGNAIDAWASSGTDDRESVVTEQPRPGVPVDPVNEISGTRRKRRQPIVPKWLRTKREVLATIRWAVNQAGYVAAFHGVRIPKYAGKVAIYAPVGAGRTVSRMARWADGRRGQLRVAPGCGHAR